MNTAAEIEDKLVEQGRYVTLESYFHWKCIKLSPTEWFHSHWCEMKK